MWGYLQKLWGKGYGDLRQLGGPVKIAQVSGDVAKMGILPFVMIISYISISLGLFNLFPIPLLDGGHIALNTIEGIRGKEFTKETIDFTYSSPTITFNIAPANGAQIAVGRINKSYKNNTTDLYQQYFFEDGDATFFVDSDGYLIKRENVGHALTAIGSDDFTTAESSTYSSASTTYSV